MDRCGKMVGGQKVGRDETKCRGNTGGTQCQWRKDITHGNNVGREKTPGERTLQESSWEVDVETAI